jgi:hypothetical protein
MPESLERLIMNISGYEDYIPHFMTIPRGIDKDWPTGLTSIRLCSSRKLRNQEMLADLAE